jgi:hypothetical protein
MKRNREIFSILFNYEKFRKFTRSLIRQKLILCLHSNSFESFIQSVIQFEDHTRDDIKFIKLINVTKFVIITPFNAFSQKFFFT